MECVILVRMLHDGDGVIGISQKEDRLFVFKNMDDAVAFADTSPLCCAMPYQIVELDEL